jgi:hypothetical protein
MEIQRGICYEELIFYLDISSIHCYDMWESLGFTGSTLSQTSHSIMWI